MTTIKYSSSKELWRIQDELKANGYRKSSDCCCIQTYIDGKGNLIALEREDGYKMKVLETLEELKYKALYLATMYDKTHYACYRRLLERSMENAMRFHGLAGLTEVVDFIKSETE